MKNSFWDNSIFRKYCSVSHNRLLSQLLAELKAYPIPRNTKTENIKQASSELRDLSPNKDRNYQINSEAHSKANTNLYSNINTLQSQKSQIISQNDDTNRSFKQRLGDIDMK